MYKIGENLKRIRNEKGITQKELAKNIGTTQQVISFFETDLKLPSTLTLLRMAKYLNCSLDELMGHKIRKD